MIKPYSSYSDFKAGWRDSCESWERIRATFERLRELEAQTSRRTEPPDCDVCRESKKILDYGHCPQCDWSWQTKITEPPHIRGLGNSYTGLRGSFVHPFKPYIILRTKCGSGAAG